MNITKITYWQELNPFVRSRFLVFAFSIFNFQFVLKFGQVKNYT